MRFACLALLCALSVVASAQSKPKFKDVAGQIQSKSPQLSQTLTDAIGADKLKKGTGWIGEGPDFVFAVQASTPPEIIIDEENAGGMTRISNSDTWYRQVKLETGRTHSFHYTIAGEPFGGDYNVPAFGPESYEKPGVPAGKLSEKIVHTSRIYPEMKSDYWIYVPAEYDPKTPAALMVWQDGEVLVPRDASRSQIVFDNLTYEKKIPVTIYILISPGSVGTKRMRSIEYDTVDDTYARFLRDEIIPEVAAKYNLRKDAYSRVIAGDSSGGICSFNVAWFHPEMFSRVLSRVGSFTSIQWHPGQIDGGNVYPFKVRREEKRNIRVWLQDGANDLENEWGSWPYTNLAMANSLKFREYDFHLSFGNGSHTRQGGAAELPEEMLWLWRDYDPNQTEQKFTMDPAEKTKPYYRVKALNRK